MTASAVSGERQSALKFPNSAGGPRINQKQGEFPEIATRDQFKSVIKQVLGDPEEVRMLSNNRSAVWRDDMVAIRDPGRADGGTFFRPREGAGAAKAHFEGLM